MDILKQSALAFEKLLKYEYEIIAGSKKTLLNMTLFFVKEHYMHLVGLHKLTDLQMQRYKRDKMYDMVIQGELTYEYIEKSAFFPEIKDRIELFPMLEGALDSNELLIKFKKGFAQGTMIEASYIFVYKHGSMIIHYFVDRDEKTGLYFGRSFLIRDDDKYLRNQQVFKILKKVKYDKYENQQIILREKKIIEKT